jgi:hypothetical protein
MAHLPEWTVVTQITGTMWGVSLTHPCAFPMIGAGPNWTVDS